MQLSQRELIIRHSIGSAVKPPATEQHHPFGCFYKTGEGCPFYWTGYPVLVTTSKLLTTGVDADTVKFIVLDSNINSMTEFKQIIGRGTRINEEHDKLYFNI